MHTTTTELGTSYHHNGDYSGEIMFNVRVTYSEQERRRHCDTTPVTDNAMGNYPNCDRETGMPLKGPGYQAITVTMPFADMLEIVMNKLRGDAVGKLQMATTDELITLLAPLGRN